MGVCLRQSTCVAAHSMVFALVFILSTTQKGTFMIDGRQLLPGNMFPSGDREKWGAAAPHEW